MPTRQLTPMSPVQQVKARALPRRLVQMFVGLTLIGASMALIIRGALGLDPWDVFHVGVALHVPLTIGQVVIVVGVVVLLAWIPLKQWPGLATVCNTIWTGVATDLFLGIVGHPTDWWARGACLVVGIVLNALAGALYIGAQLGTGPRDGLMTGLSARFGWSLRAVRTVLELSALVVGWLLGGGVGFGTVLYALTIGPLVQFLLPWCIVELDAPHPAQRPPRHLQGEEPPLRPA